METLSSLGMLVAQIPASIRDQFSVSLITDSYFLAPTARFRHSSGAIIETRVETTYHQDTKAVQLVLPEDTVARLCVIAR